ncbi:S41 family peptidase [Streptomyces sp. NPDC088812]|uniref:S41 family peptidase n=1 Tax=Streptomyces sp. NPDC088812 TaxID=3365905 RepID=UPI00380E6E08
MSDTTATFRIRRKRSRRGTSLRRVPKWGVALGISALVVGAGSAADAGTVSRASAQSDAPALCQELPSDQDPAELPASTPTTVTTLHQVYRCVLDHHYRGSRLDTRVLLRDAFAEFTVELQQRGLDRPEATLGELTGHRERDWASFAQAYRGVLDALSADADLREILASAVIRGMLGSLDDNHAGWDSRPTPPAEAPTRYGYGILDASSGSETPANIKDATPPLYVKLTVPGSPADEAGLLPGDIMVAVNGVPVVTDGILNAGSLGALRPTSGEETLRLTVERPATGKTWTVEMRPDVITSGSTAAMSVTLLPGDIAKVVLPSFYIPDVADDVLAQIAKLRETTQLRGVVFDVRGNMGGRVEQTTQLISSFVHGKLMSRDCDLDNHCTENRTDDSVPLLNLPLSVVTDGDCASACEDFVANVKYLGLGEVVGERTRGEASGLQVGYRLDNNTVLLLPRLYRTFAHGEQVDGIGVPVDHRVPLTAADISNGRDPAVDKARELLSSPV